jgi:hypothetical protein
MGVKYRFNDNDTPPIPKPEGKKRRGNGKRMSEDELQRIMSGLISDAQTLSINELSDARITATEYYKGDPLGNEEEGRSQFVVTEVRDQVLGVKPSLLRIFLAPDPIVEFMPTTEKGVPAAKQATDYCNFVFTHQNPGYRLLNDVLDDGLIRRYGIFKWAWEEGEVIAHCDEDLTLDELFALVAKDEVTPTHISDNGKSGDEYRATVEYTMDKEGYVRLGAVPQEEFFFDREANDIEHATMVGHGRNLSRGELIAIGVSAEDIDAHGGKLTTLSQSADEMERQENSTPNVGENPDGGEANELHLYCETYTMVDVDGDGRRELRKICTLGPAFYVVYNKPCSDRPFSLFTPIPEAHALIGLGLSDLVMDLQYVKTNTVRGILDSFALSIYPRVAFIEGQASVEDVLNTEIGAPIRTKSENAVQSFSHNFTGQGAMPLVEYFDQIGENRTGRNKGAMSLDADALQSSSPGAVAAALSAAQERTEFIARMFAEQALKPMFMGIYRLLVKHKPKASLMKLRGEYIQVDIAEWDADFSCYVKVGLGTSLPEQRIALIEKIAAKQEMIMSTEGGDNPLCGVGELRHSYARMLELSGEHDVSSYFKSIPPNYQPPQPPPPPPTPEETTAKAMLEIERMKAVKDIAIKQAELDLKTRTQEFNESFQIAKLAQDSTLKRYQIDSQFDAQHTQLMEQLDAQSDVESIKAIIAGQKLVHAERASARQTAQAEAARQHEAEQNDADRMHEAGMQAAGHEHEQALQDSAPVAQGE